MPKGKTPKRRARSSIGSARIRGVAPTNKATLTCVWFRSLVHQAREAVLDAAPDRVVHSQHLLGKVVAKTKELATKHVEYQQLLTTLKKDLKPSVQRQLKHFRNRDRWFDSQEYKWYDSTELLEHPGKHTGSCCKRCKDANFYPGVYGMGNVTKSGGLMPKVRCSKQQPVTTIAKSKVVGMMFVRGEKIVTTYASLIASAEAGEAPELEVYVKTKAQLAYVKGYKKGGKKAKKDNEVHQEEAGMWNMYGNRLSGGRMLRSRMIGFDSTTQSKQRSGDRLENERTGKTPRRDRSGVWGKNSDNVNKLIAELDAR